ncbi:probable low-specificity L-threonine aldolase 2 [Plutella xylostella]|uniref:probable low-specificity L-threonine aldolase 2 n=1 Tax=Plutella xylostella TaxID=51655 RepID=UPI0020331166|nr:probable low-specificity L-threonine aldolase 2 [Plutella xylostella]
MTHIVDLRSDTVTKPTDAMRHAMVNSAVGNDVYGEDPTVNALERKIATMLDKQAALFVPSGTMANLIAVMVHCSQRGSEALVGNMSHIFKYEQGGAAHLGGVLLTTLENKPDGTFDLDEFEKRIRGSDIHEPLTAMIAVENTHNYCGGKVLPQSWLDDLYARATKHSIPVHMDGARLFNACAAQRSEPATVVRGAASVSICFSKGLSAPVGSVLVGDCHFIQKARRLRKMLGGGMRQAGVLAAAALVALDEVVPNLEHDHRRAQVLATTIKSLCLKNFTVDLQNTQTNILLVRIPESSPITADKVVQRLAQVCLSETQGDCKTADDEGVIVKAIYFNSKTIRFTLHCGIEDEDLWLAIMKITFVFKEFEASV